jgi:hypothetical protein
MDFSGSASSRLVEQVGIVGINPAGVHRLVSCAIQ